jgi:hypothetical protein
VTAGIMQPPLLELLLGASSSCDVVTHSCSISGWWQYCPSRDILVSDGHTHTHNRDILANFTFSLLNMEIMPSAATGTSKDC